MKNYVKEGQKLPLFGIGPYMITAMTILTLIGTVLSETVLSSGRLEGGWAYVSGILGIVLIGLGGTIWFTGAMRSGMDKNISENKLKTDGIYAWVRNPMYSGIWIFLTGMTLMWRNLWILIIPVINWLIMTIVLINTEEKWLLSLYGQEYEEYKKHVNRCIPFKRS